MQAIHQGAVSTAETFLPEKTIAIVGAGFSGTTVAIQLLRCVSMGSCRGTLRIVLIDPREEIGAGVAYATRDYPYPLNVAAGQMSIDGAKPTDFLDFVQHQGIHASAGDYLPRQVYGAYLRTRLEEARTQEPNRWCNRCSPTD